MKEFSMADLLKYRTGLTSDMLEMLAEYAGVGILSFHLPTGNIALNHNIAQLAGYEPGDLPHTGNTKEMLTFEDDRAQMNRAIEGILSGETDHYKMEYRMRRKDSSIVSIEENMIVCERDADGQPVRLAGLALDLSRLRWAEDRARRLEQENRRLVAGLSEGVLAEQNRMLRAANHAATMIIGGFHQNYETVLRQALQILAESIQADQVYIWRNLQQDGQMCCFSRAFWCKEESSIMPSADTIFSYDDYFPDWQNLFQEHYSIRATVADLPPQMQAFPAISEAKSMLLAPLFLHGEFWGLLGFNDCSNGRQFTEDEAEIMVSGAMVIASSVSRNETFSKLEEARQEAMASTRAKGEFLSRMSHEIRTPMNAIIGMTSIAKQSSDPERIRYCLEKVDASSRQLLNLINDILDMSKIDSGKMEIIHDEFDFEKMIENVINVTQVKLSEKHQDLKVEFNRMFSHLLVGDELRLSQVLLNLLSNATKFTPEHGQITLKIEQTEVDKDRIQLRVEVKDTGIGISEEQQQKLFHSFEQADGSITRQYGGTGLGLAICKKIVSLMHGNIWVESELHQGSSFIFELQIGVSEKPLLRVAPQTLPENMRVLVVDDAEDVREYFTNMMESFAIDCDVADCGAAAIKLVEQSIREGRPYQMIFIDWQMPDMNGATTAKYIHEQISGDAMVIMISVADWNDIEKDVQDCGINRFLPKPVLPSTLYDTMLELMSDSNGPPQVVAKTASYAWPKRTILLAEDIEINREIIRTVLEDTGIQIVDAEDGNQAVSLFAADPTRFDLILMDIQMPNCDGLTATKIIRGMDVPQAAQVPIIAMTANAFKEDEDKCLEAGMNRHLSKPLDVEQLRSVLSAYFN